MSQCPYNLDHACPTTAALAAIKELHTQKDEYCSVCLDPTGWSEEWPCPTAEAWGEK